MRVPSFVHISTYVRTYTCMREIPNTLLLCAKTDHNDPFRVFSFRLTLLRVYRVNNKPKLARKGNRLFNF